MEVTEAAKQHESVRVVIARIRTWFSNGTELSGSGGLQEIGYSSLQEMQAELIARWNRCYIVTKIPNGIEMHPRPWHNCSHGKQTVEVI